MQYVQMILCLADEWGDGANDEDKKLRARKDLKITEERKTGLIRSDEQSSGFFNTSGILDICIFSCL